LVNLRLPTKNETPHLVRKPLHFSGIFGSPESFRLSEKSLLLFF
jgi:hypothetical protein